MFVKPYYKQRGYRNYVKGLTVVLFIVGSSPEVRDESPELVPEWRFYNDCTHVEGRTNRDGNTADPYCNIWLRGLSLSPPHPIVHHRVLCSV